MNYYEDKNLYYILNKYQKNKGDSAIKTELKRLARLDIPDYSKDYFNFVNDALAIANNYKDNEVVTLCNEVANQMKKTSGTDIVHSSVLEDSLETENDCLIAVKECLKNGQYQSVLKKVLDYVIKEDNYACAIQILNFILSSNIIIDKDEKYNILMFFILRMRKHIDNHLKWKHEDYGYHYYDLIAKEDAKKDFNKMCEGKYSFKSNDVIHINKHNYEFNGYYIKCRNVFLYIISLSFLQNYREFCKIEKQVKSGDINGNKKRNSNNILVKDWYIFVSLFALCFYAIPQWFITITWLKYLAPIFLTILIICVGLYIKKKKK